MKTRTERFYPLTVLLFSIGYASYFISRMVFVVCAAPLVLLLAPFPRAKYRFLRLITQTYLVFLARRYLPALGVYRIVEISGLRQATAVQPVLYVANHRGRMDALLLLSLLPSTGVVIRTRHKHQITFALLTRHFDFIGVDPERLSSVASALEQSQRLLASGRSLLVFPEGGRAPSGRLQRFKGIAFQLASKAGIPVVPVVIHSTWPFMAKVPGSIFPRGRNEYRVRFLDPEYPRPDDGAQELCDRVYRRMANELKQLDAATPWEVARPARDE